MLLRCCTCDSSSFTIRQKIGQGIVRNEGLEKPWATLARDRCCSGCRFSSGWRLLVSSVLLFGQFAPGPALQWSMEMCPCFQMAMTHLKQRHDKVCVALDRLSSAVTQLSPC